MDPLVELRVKSEALGRVSPQYFFYPETFPITLNPPNMGYQQMISNVTLDCIGLDFSPDKILGRSFRSVCRKPILARIALVRCVGCDITRRQLIRDVRAINPKYRLPKAWHALLFAGLYPDEQRKRPIVFFHKPIEFEGERSIIVLEGGIEWRHIILESVGDYRTLFDKCYNFAFVVEE